MRRRNDIDGVCNRIDHHSDRRRRGFLVAVRPFNRNRDNGHSRESAAFIRWREKVDVANLSERNCIGLGAVGSDSKCVFGARAIGQLGIGIDAPDLDLVGFRAIKIVAKRSCKIVEVDKRIFVGGFRITGCGNGVGHSFDIDRVSMMNCGAVEVAGQTGRDVRFNRGNRNVERQLSVQIFRRVQRKGRQQSLNACERTSDFVATGRGCDESIVGRIPRQRGTSWKTANDNFLDGFRAVLIAQINRDGNANGRVFICRCRA